MKKYSFITDLIKERYFILNKQLDETNKKLDETNAKLDEANKNLGIIFKELNNQLLHIEKNEVNLISKVTDSLEKSQLKDFEITKFLRASENKLSFIQKKVECDDLKNRIEIMVSNSENYLANVEDIKTLIKIVAVNNILDDDKINELININNT